MHGRTNLGVMNRFVLVQDKARHGAMFTVGTPPEPLGSQRNRHSCGSISG